jgi:N-acyl amino acid synthase of PEP-CTERM/exosortase system
MLALQSAAMRPSPASRIIGLPPGRFKLIPVTTPAQREQVHRLRYQIYCVEYPYENPSQFAGGLEHDEFDTHSVYRLIYDYHIEQAIGTVRLILPQHDCPTHSFPIQRICRHPLVRNPDILKGAAEVSRFAISKSARSPRHVGTHQTFSSSLLTIKLLKGVVQMSREQGISDLFAVMEPRLLRLLASRFAFHFNPIGPPVDYHGIRQPCHANLNRLLERTRRENFAVWSFITATDHHV